MDIPPPISPDDLERARLESLRYHEYGIAHDCQKCRLIVALVQTPERESGFTWPLLQKEVDDIYGGVVPEGREVVR